MKTNKRSELAVAKAFDFFKEFREKQGDNGLTYKQASALAKKHRVSPDRIFHAVKTGYVSVDASGKGKRYKYLTVPVVEGQVRKIVEKGNSLSAAAQRKTRSIAKGIPAPSAPAPKRDVVDALVNKLKSLGYSGEIKKTVSIQF